MVTQVLSKEANKDTEPSQKNQHTVKSGDTVSRIASQYAGISTAAVLEANGLKPDSTIHPNQILDIPIKHNVREIVPAINTVTSERNSGEIPKIERGLIVIDPGHGGDDPGAVVTCNGVQHCEKDLALKMAKKLKEKLERRGLRVKLTREDDTTLSLSERANFTKKQNPAAFISVHANAAPVGLKGQIKGHEVFYSSGTNRLGKESESLNLAHTIDQELDGVSSQQGIDSARETKLGNYQVLREQMYEPYPSVLLELGFMDHNQELGAMLSEEYQDSQAEAVAIAIADKVDA